MPVVHRTSLVPYTAAQMYALVNDVDAYPAFLPGCRSARRIAGDDDEVTAEVELARGALHRRFITRNRLQRNKMIEMRLVDGPFRQLEGFWRFDELDEGRASRVTLDLEFEFSSRVVALAIGPVFNAIANSLVDAFAQRAREVYGKSA